MKRHVLAQIMGLAMATSNVGAAPASDAAVPVLVVEVKDEASNTISAVRVTMDGAPLLDRLDGTAVPVTPGEHRLVFDAAGFRRTETTFVAREGQKVLRVVVFLDSTGSAAPGQLMVPSTAGAPVQHALPKSSATRRQYVGLALGGAGIAGVAVGTIWSVMAKAKYDHAVESECGGDPNRCSAQGIADGRTAHSQAAVATVAFVTAGALLAAGAVLYFTGREQAGVAVAPTLDGSGGLAVVGTW